MASNTGSIKMTNNFDLSQVNPDCIQFVDPRDANMQFQPSPVRDRLMGNASIYDVDVEVVSKHY